MDYVVRLAKEEDCSALAKVKREVWETTYRGIYSDSRIDGFNFEEQEADFKVIINNPDIDLYVVVVNDEIVGYMSHGKPLNPFYEYDQEIGVFYLLEKYQKNGIGKDLFNLAYENIKSRGYDKFFVSCNKYNYSAQKFYEKMGGKIVFVDEDIEDDKYKIQIKFHYDVK